MVSVTKGVIITVHPTGETDPSKRPQDRSRCPGFHILVTISSDARGDRVYLRGTKSGSSFRKRACNVKSEMQGGRRNSCSSSSAMGPQFNLTQERITHRATPRPALTHLPRSLIIRRTPYCPALRAPASDVGSSALVFGSGFQRLRRRPGARANLCSRRLPARTLSGFSRCGSRVGCLLPGCGSHDARYVHRVELHLPRARRVQHRLDPRRRALPLLVGGSSCSRCHRRPRLHGRAYRL